jgi:hypothetical protein
MSQSATFYPIDSNEFSAIERDPNSLEILKDRENFIAFAGTHEGIRFVLSKGLDKEQTDLVNEIFYPTTYIGEASQYIFPNAEEVQEFVDITEVEDDDFDREPIFYHDPGKVKQIASLLERMNSEQFLSQFNPEELNTETIYPRCWNNSQEKNRTYNLRHILEEYQNLKGLFNNASVRNSYLLCFVG